MRHRDPLFVIALKEILVADVVLKAIIDAFKVDREGILRIGQTDASLAQHVEDMPSHDTVACQLSVERQYRGHPELCRIVRGQHGSRGEQYTAIVATEQQLTFGQLPAGHAVVFLIESLIGAELTHAPCAAVEGTEPTVCTDHQQSLGTMANARYGV